jgi:rod shape-determining protein MreC
MRLPRAFLIYLFFTSLSFLILLTNIKVPSSRYLAWRNLILHLYAPALWSAEDFVLDNLNLPREVLDLLTARRQNEELKKIILEYENKVSSYEALAAENDFLRRSAALAPRPGYTFVTVEVVARDVAGWSLSCIINKGSSSGIKKNSAATLLKNGRFVLAGKVVEVADSSAQVMLLTNPAFAVPAVVVGSGSEGLVEHADSRTLVLNYPSPLSAPVGSEVVVGSMSRIFPPGLLIGRVLDNRGRITLNPEFARLPSSKMVLIVRK